MQIDKKNIVKCVIENTMETYGSDAGENKVPGSKLKSQVDHIADYLEQIDNLESILQIHEEEISMLHNLKIVWNY